MADEVLARAALLIGVALAGEDEGALDGRAVGRLGGVGGMLADHREQVPEQGPLFLAEALGDLVVGGDGGTVRLDADAGVAIAFQHDGVVALVSR
jgi:hypothetical protein